MKIFRRVSSSVKQHSKILWALKKDFEKAFSGFEPGDILCEVHEQENQFFLKNPKRIIWGKLYFETFTKKHMELLKIEAECLRRTFPFPIAANIFFTKTDMETKDLLEFTGACYYRFFPAEAGIEDALFLEKVVGEPVFQMASTAIPAEPENEPEPGQEVYRFSKQSMLNKEELAELIDLSINLRSF